MEYLGLSEHILRSQKNMSKPTYEEIVSLGVFPFQDFWKILDPQLQGQPRDTYGKCVELNELSVRLKLTSRYRLKRKLIDAVEPRPSPL